MMTLTEVFRLGLMISSIITQGSLSDSCNFLAIFQQSETEWGEQRGVKALAGQGRTPINPRSKNRLK